MLMREHNSTLCAHEIAFEFKKSQIVFTEAWPSSNILSSTNPGDIKLT